MEEDTTGTVEIRQYAALLLRWLWLIALAALLAGGVAYVQSKATTPIYEASATLVISPGNAAYDSYNAIYAGQELAQTYAQMLTGRPVLEGAEARLGGPLDLAGVSATPVRDTQLIRLSVRHADPARAAAIANAIPAVFAEINEENQLARYRTSQESLAAEMESLQAEMEAAQRALERERTRPTPDAAEVGRLETILAQYRSTYAGLLQSYEDLRVAQARGISTLTVFEPAAVPVDPVLPRTRQNTLLAAVVGAMLAAGAAFLIEYLDDTVKQSEDVERTVHLPTFGTVLRFSSEELEAAGPLMAAEPRSSTAEAYRVLRTNLQFATAGLGSSAMVLVTSAGPGEGKTTTLVNLGVALAQAGKRVLLVDTDLRRPALHKQFGLANEAGLTTLFLAPQAPLDGLIRATGVGGLSVITSGPIPANPAEVLEFPRTAELLDELRARADYVLLDCPPVLSVADASILAQKADGVLLVAVMGRTRTGVFKNAALTLERVQARLLGVVLNKVRARRGSYYYYYHYGDYAADGGGKRRRRRAAPPGRRGQAVAGQATAQGKDAVVRAAQSAMNARRRRRNLLRAACVAGGAAAVLMLGTLALLAAGGRLGGLGGGEPPTAAPTAATLPAAPIVALSPTTAPTRAPTAVPATPTPAPPTPSPSATATLWPTATATLAPAAGLHGAAARLRLRDAAATYAAGQPVAFVVELENTTAQPLAAGIVGLKPDGGLPFLVTATGVTIEPGAVYTGEGQLTFPAAGTYTVVASACFSPEDACRAGTGAWEEFAPGITVTVQ